jgi:ATP-dependent Clp protease protease subunit
MSEKWFNIQNKSPETGEIYIYGTITDEKWYDEDVTPTWFKNEVQKLNGVKNIDVHINSGGGGVFAGLAIYNMIKRLTANVTTYIDGLAASTASWIGLAAKKVVMPKNAMMMIHNPMSIVMGYASDLRKEADVLDQVKGVIVSSLQRGKKSLSDDKIGAMMDAETWMDGQQAYDNGFVDVVETSKLITASINNKKLVINGIEFDTEKYKAFPGIIQPKEAPIVFDRVKAARKKLNIIQREAANA